MLKEMAEDNSKTRQRTFHSYLPENFWTDRYNHVLFLPKWQWLPPASGRVVCWMTGICFIRDNNYVSIDTF